MGQTPQGPNNTYLTPALKTTYLNPAHRKMVRLVASGARPEEIQSITGYSAGQVSRILASPHFQIAVDDLVNRAEEQAIDLREDFKQMAELAVENVYEDLTMEVNNRFDRALRQSASKDWLDRMGIRKQTLVDPSDKRQHEKDAAEKSDKDLQDEVLDLVRTASGGYE